ncbi:MAG TPA: monovalent cation:proton antiporter-2 (CPA2) family protein [Caulobacteraceae bacterium]|nr:monovalent cation:proton antiporter-2 (CPA2) family protein [Caulobacteraceae bacterium]
MNGRSLLIQALVYLAAGVASVPIAKRLGLGSVLGYLIAGVLIGPFALGLVGQQADVMRFAEFGVVFLLFLIGLEVRPALLWSLRGAIFGLGGAQVVAVSAAIAVGGLLAGLHVRTALAVGLILSMSSTAIVLQMIEERGQRSSPVGKAAFGVLLLQDLAVIPLFAILPLLALGAPVAASQNGGLFSAEPAWVQGLAILGAVAVVAGGGRYLIRPAFRFIAAARLREIFTASALLLVIAVAALMEMVGLSPALGAFLAGVMLAESEFRRELETDIEPFRGLFLGLFFITVGAGLNLGVVAAQPLTLIGAVLGIMTIKGLVMYGLGRAARLQPGDAASTAVLLCQVGEFAFVLIGFAASGRVLDASLAALLTAAVALSMALTPLATLAFDRLAERFSSLNPRPEPENKPFDPGAPDAIIAGFGRFGQIAGRLLIANGFSTVVLDSSIEQVETLRRFGRRVHYGDATRLDLLRQAGAAKAKVLVVAIDDRDEASKLVESAKAAFPDLKILARAFDRRHAYDLLRNGADAVERETFESALLLGVRTLRVLGFRAHRAYRAGSLFRQHDLRAFNELAPVAGEEERYILAVRDSQSTMERLLKADLDRLRPDYVDEAWDVTSLNDELTGRSAAPEAGADDA